MKRLIFILGLVAVMLSSCGSDDDAPQGAAPQITLDSETGIYTVKAGRDLTITPTYRNTDDATVYVWSVEGVSVCQTPAFTFRSEETGSTFVQLKVTNGYGSDSEEMRIDVVETELPVISFPEAKDGFTVVVNSPLELHPEVMKSSLDTRFSWKVDGREVSTEQYYTFRPTREATYRLQFSTRNDDGSDSIEFEVRACSEEEMPIAWEFPAETYRLSQGRRICLAPCHLDNAQGAVFVWTVDGREQQRGERSDFVFDGAVKGSSQVVVTMTKGSHTLSHTLSVEVCDPEGTFRREKTSASSAAFQKVYSFLPAPGQFVNEGYSCATAEEAAAKADELLKASKYVSLGGFGGQIVVGFDHSVANSGDYDFTVSGNSFDGSSEPGVVWVMQDENGDGLPNDTWYELKGSESGKPETVQDYAVTYYRPRAAHMAVQWVDNRGQRGTIDYMGEFHRQDFYFPEWVTDDSYTLYGTRLEPRNHIEDGIWVNGSYDWGYADNNSASDGVPGQKGINRFKISDAVTFEGKPARLQYIDFVKVQCAVNAKSGQIGELSTEVLGFSDYNMNK